MKPSVMYRYAAFTNPKHDAGGYEILQGVEIKLITLTVLRTTPTGVWCREWHSNDPARWIGLHSERAFAYASKEDAMNSFKIRNMRHIQHLNRALTKANLAKTAIAEGVTTLHELMFKFGTTSEEDPNGPAKI